MPRRKVEPIPNEIDSSAVEPVPENLPALEQVPAADQTKPPVEDSIREESGRVRGAVCPVNAEHGGVRVYKTEGRLRYLSCGTCGKHWKWTGPRYSRPLPWVESLAQRLETAASRPQIVEGASVVVFSAEDISRTAAALRQIADQSRAEFETNGAPPAKTDPEEESRKQRGRR